MTQKALTLAEEVLDLDTEDREYLIYRLKESIPDNQVDLKPEQAPEQDAFDKELLRRVEAADRGEMGFVDGKEMIAKSREWLRKAREQANQ